MAEPLCVVGLNQSSTSIDVFERTTLSNGETIKALQELAECSALREVVILSTCMRTEVYAVVDRFHDGVAQIYDLFTRLLGTSFEDIADLMYCKYEDAAAAHLFEVAAGLSSPVLGEGEVLGQVRRAWDVARAEKTCGQVLSSLFRHAVMVGKQVRSETAIARGMTSLSHAAVALASDRLAEGLDGRRVLLLGAGAMGKGMATALASKTSSQQSPADPVAHATEPSARGLSEHARGPEIVVISRTVERAALLAEQMGAQWRSLSALQDELAAADVVLVSVATPSFVLSAAAIEEAMSQRPDRPLLVVDLGVPRNVDSQAGKVASVTLIDLDRLRLFVNAQMAGREAEVDRARSIVAEEVVRYGLSRRERDVAPLVAAFHQQAEEIRRSEIDRHSSQLDAMDERERELVESLTRAILSKLLHRPTVKLKEAGRSGASDRLSEALRDLFDLEPGDE